MKISTIGNCQTQALTWYIKKLNPKFDVKWVQPEFTREAGWAHPGVLLKESIETVMGEKDSINRLKQSSFLIYQPMDLNKSKNFNFQKIKSYNPECCFISINSFYFLPGCPKQTGLSGMIERAKRFNIDIPAHKLIEKHGSKITIEESSQNPAHPRVFYFLELMREICNKTGWDYYSDKQYNEYIKKEHPFYK